MEPLNRRTLLATAASLLITQSASRTFAQLSRPGDVSWLTAVQKPPEAPPQDLRQLPSLLRQPDGTPIQTRSQWLIERERLRKAWLEFLGPMPPEPPAIQLEVLAEDHPQGSLRRRVRYETEPGIFVEAFLLIPDDDVPGKGPDGRRAGLVALHQTSNDTIYEIAGVRGPESQHLGLNLARQGFVVFCPLNFLWHDARDIRDAVAKWQARRPQTRGMHKMLWDAQRGVDALQSLKNLVDPARMGAVGHSLGAKETLYLAAFDERIRASVASEGGIGFDFTNWHDPWYLGDAIRKPDFPLNHHQLLALIAPRACLILGGESGPGAADGDRTWPYIEAALPVYRLFDPPARIGLLNHREGHTISPASLERLTEWLRVYLSPRDA